MKLNIRFIIYKLKTNISGNSSIRCRIAFYKKRLEFSTRLFINPTNWNSKQQIVKPLEPDAEIINTHLSLIKTKINKAFLMFQVQEISFTVEDIYSLYKGGKSARE